MIQIAAVVLISLFIASCGKDTLTDSENEINPADETEAELAAEPEQETEQAAEPEKSLPDNLVEIYTTEDIKYVDEVIPAQYTDDLSLLTDMKYTNSTYVYQDGKVYYRRYHADSYEETALGASYDYHPIPGTKKEIVCVDADGVETVLFTDEGYGDIYLVDNRFYMTDGKQYEKDGNIYTEEHLYSVDMKGKNRIDYGNGSIYVVDVERKIFILKMKEDYYLMNYETGEKKPLLYEPDEHFYFNIEGYQDGWLYYENGESDFSRLCAVSIEGKEKEIITVTSNKSLNNEISYHESILDFKVDEDRIYFIYGGYDGTARGFQGGTLISVKPDGTDYKAINVQDDNFYISHDKGKTLVYFPRYDDDIIRADGSEEYDMLVWDVDADMCYCSDFSTFILSSYKRRIGLMWHYYPADKGVLCSRTPDMHPLIDKTDIYAIPGDSGKIVRVVMDIEQYVAKWKGKDIDKVEYDDFYFADGVLYFKAEYSAYDRDTSIGWRDSYRRLHTDIYRLKIGESKAEVLYSY